MTEVTKDISVMSETELNSAHLLNNQPNCNILPEMEDTNVDSVKLANSGGRYLYDDPDYIPHSLIKEDEQVRKERNCRRGTCNVDDSEITRPPVSDTLSITCPAVPEIDLKVEALALRESGPCVSSICDLKQDCRDSPILDSVTGTNGSELAMEIRADPKEPGEKFSVKNGNTDCTDSQVLSARGGKLCVSLGESVDSTQSFSSCGFSPRKSVFSVLKTICKKEYVDNLETSALILAKNLSVVQKMEIGKTNVNITPNLCKVQQYSESTVKHTDVPYEEADQFPITNHPLMESQVSNLNRCMGREVRNSEPISSTWCMSSKDSNSDSVGSISYDFTVTSINRDPAATSIGAVLTATSKSHAPAATSINLDSAMTSKTHDPAATSIVPYPDPSLSSKYLYDPFGTLKVPYNDPCVTSKFPNDPCVTSKFPNDPCVTSKVPNNDPCVTSKVTSKYSNNDLVATSIDCNNDLVVTSKFPDNDQFVTSNVPNNEQFVTSNVPDNEQFVTSNVPDNEQFVTSNVPNNEQFVPSNVPNNEQFVTSNVPNNEQFLTSEGTLNEVESSDKDVPPVIPKFSCELSRSKVAQTQDKTYSALNSLIESMLLTPSTNTTEILSSIPLTPSIDRTEILSFITLPSSMDNTDILSSITLPSSIDRTEILSSITLPSSMDNTDILSSITLTPSIDTTNILSSIPLPPSIDTTDVLTPMPFPSKGYTKVTDTVPYNVHNFGNGDLCKEKYTEKSAVSNSKDLKRKYGDLKNLERGDSKKRFTDTSSRGDQGIREGRRDSPDYARSRSRDRRKRDKFHRRSRSADLSKRVKSPYGGRLHCRSRITDVYKKNNHLLTTDLITKGSGGSKQVPQIRTSQKECCVNKNKENDSKAHSDSEITECVETSDASEKRLQKASLKDDRRFPAEKKGHLVPDKSITARPKLWEISNSGSICKKSKISSLSNKIQCSSRIPDNSTSKPKQANQTSRNSQIFQNKSTIPLKPISESVNNCGNPTNSVITTTTCSRKNVKSMCSNPQAVKNKSKIPLKQKCKSGAAEPVPNKTPCSPITIKSNTSSKNIKSQTLKNKSTIPLKRASDSNSSSVPSKKVCLDNSKTSTKVTNGLTSTTVKPKDGVSNKGPTTGSAKNVKTKELPSNKSKTVTNAAKNSSTGISADSSRKANGEKPSKIVKLSTQVKGTSKGSASVLSTKTKPANVTGNQKNVSKHNSNAVQNTQNFDAVLECEDNDLIRQVKKRWGCDAIPSPEINLTCANYWRKHQKGNSNKTQTILEGYRRYSPLIERLMSREKSRPGRLGDRRKRRNQDVLIDPSSEYAWDGKRAKVANEPGTTCKVAASLQEQLKKAENNFRERYGMLRNEQEESTNHLKAEQNSSLQEMRFRHTQEMQYLYSNTYNIHGLHSPFYDLRTKHRNEMLRLQNDHFRSMSRLEEQMKKKIYEERKSYADIESQLKQLVSHEARRTDKIGPDVPYNTIKLAKAPCRQNQQRKSWIEVLLPEDIGAAMTQEDFIYDAFYKY